MAHSPAAKDSSLCVVKMKKHMYFAQYIFTEESLIYLNIWHLLVLQNSFHSSFIFRGKHSSGKITISGTSEL